MSRLAVLLLPCLCQPCIVVRSALLHHGLFFFFSIVVTAAQKIFKKESHTERGDVKVKMSLTITHQERATDTKPRNQDTKPMECSVLEGFPRARLKKRHGSILGQKDCTTHTGACPDIAALLMDAHAISLYFMVSHCSRELINSSFDSFINQLMSK